MPRFKAIAAMSENRVIGREGGIPWHLPEDFKWFKRTTMGATLVMGRKTFESIGRPLPGRSMIVLSRRPLDIPGVQVLHSLEALKGLTADAVFWIAGGAEIYGLLLPDCDELYLTRVHRTLDGDAFFPAFERRFRKTGHCLETEAFTVERWERLAAW